jgi:hypothetical protein
MKKLKVFTFSSCDDVHINLKKNLSDMIISLSSKLFITFYIINNTLFKRLDMHTVGLMRGSHLHDIHTVNG